MVWLVKEKQVAQQATTTSQSPERNPMLTTIAIVLIILWLLGLVSGYTLGSFIHILLVVAIIMILVRFISSR
jgi:hypothetical protein